MDLGTRVRLLREAHGLSQRELATKAGVETLTINRIERGHRQPRPETLRFLVEALGTSERALLTDAGFAVEMLAILGIPLEDLAREAGWSSDAAVHQPATDDEPVTRGELRKLLELLGGRSAEPPGEKSEPPRSEPIADGGGKGRGGRR